MEHSTARGYVPHPAAILLFLLASAVVPARTSAVAAAQEWPGPFPGITYQELRPLVDQGDLFLLDVRNRSEVLSPGRVPFSLNLPLPELASALQLPAGEFKQKYGFNLPSPQEKEIILMCRSGRRVQVAAKILIPAGYDNLRIYYGSFNNWLKNGAPISRLVTNEENSAISQALARPEVPQWKYPMVDVRLGQNVPDFPGTIDMTSLALTPASYAEKLGSAKPGREEPVVLIGSNTSELLRALPMLNRLSYYSARLYIYSP